MLKIILFLTFAYLFSFASTVKIDDKLTKIDVTSNVKVYKDSTESLLASSFASDREPDGFISARSMPSIQKGVYWFCIDAQNASFHNIEWVLAMPRANVEGKIYLFTNGVLVKTTDIKDSFAPFNHPSLAYAGASAPKSKSRVVIRVSFGDGWFIYPQFELFSKNSFNAKTYTDTALKSAALGGAIALLLYNLFIFFSLRSRAYGWYCVYMGMVGAFISANSGLGWELFWRDNEFLAANAFAIFYPLTFAAALQFSREFLSLKERFESIDLAFKIILVAIVLFPIYSVFVSRTEAIRFFPIITGVMFVMPALGFYVWYKGYKEARFYAIAWSAWSIGMIAPTAAMLGADLGHDEAAMSARAGLMLEAVTLSFALGDRINILRKERDEALLQYESQKALTELHSRQAQMGEMMSVISHQWKQPLNLLSLTAQNVKYMLEEEKLSNKEEIFNEINSISSVINHMSSTMEDFKNFFSPSKIKRRFYVAPMMRNILEMTGKQYEHAGVVVNIDGDDKLSVYGKENELKQTILNLFNNAKDAFLEKGVKNAKISANVSLTEDGFVQIIVKDNAGGIPKEFLDKVFERYFTTKGEEGTGLGLYICKKIVEDSFGGKMSVQNVDGGAEFRIFLPVS